MGQKNEVNPIWACRAFPAYPVVLAAMGNADGTERNVITIALVHMFSFNPPVLGIGVSPSRYSYDLFDKCEDFSINVPGKELVEEVLYCGQRSGKDVNKFEECGFSFSKGKKINAPIIHDCMVNMECRKVNKFDAGDHTWFLGEVVHAEMEESLDRGRALMYWAGEFRVLGDLIRRR